MAACRTAYRAQDLGAGAEDSNAAIAVDADLVPTLDQLQSQWAADDEEIPVRDGASATATPTRPGWVWLFEILLIWLNAVHGLSETVCGHLLTFIAAVAGHSGASGAWPSTGEDGDRLSVRMRRIRKSLWHGSSAVTYALCPKAECWTPHLVRQDGPRNCRRCGDALYDDSGENDSLSITRATPRLPLYYEPISSWLSEFALRPDFFDLCAAWKTSPRTPGVLADIYDGESWRSDVKVQLLDYLSLTIMIDSMQPFSRAGTKSYSVCVVSVRIDNLSTDKRNGADNTHVCCLLPGPAKPQAQALHAVLDVVITELHRLASVGLSVRDWRGRRRTIFAHLRRVLADSECRTTVAGFPHHSSKAQFCPWCDADGDTWVEQFLEDQPFQPRTFGQHRRDALRALRDYNSALTPQLLKKLRKEGAAGPCAFYKLDGWSSLTMAPVDVMHALDLGLCKHFWTETLITGGLLGDGDLQTCQRALARVTYPLGVSKISSNLGDVGGGSPTASAWSILARYVLPVLLATCWYSFSPSKTKDFKSSKQTLTAARSSPSSRKRKRGQASTSATGERPGDGYVVELESSAETPSVTETVQTKKMFIRPVRVFRLMEAALHLAHACRVAHAAVLSERQVEGMHENIVHFVKIMATDIHCQWLAYNGHIVLHIADQILQHGPPRQYWMYPAERSYGRMKQIKTNKRRDGSIELTLQGRSDDRHRIATVVSRLPPTDASAALRHIVASERPAAEQSAPLVHAKLSNADLDAVCAIANARKRPGDAPIVSIRSQGTSDVESVLGPACIRLSRIQVKHGTLAPQTRSRSSDSDSSACIVRIGGALRLARFESAFIHSFFDANTEEKRSTTYAVVHAMPSLPWPRSSLMEMPSWANLGYICAQDQSPTRHVVPTESIRGAAITIQATELLDHRAGIIGVEV